MREEERATERQWDRKREREIYTEIEKKNYEKKREDKTQETETKCRFYLLSADIEETRNPTCSFRFLQL